MPLISSLSAGVRAFGLYVLSALVTVIDTFNRSDNASDLGSAGGQKWKIWRGIWGIATNKASSSTTASSYPIATLTFTQNDVNIGIGGPTPGTGTSFWLSDGDNWWAAVYDEVYSCQTCAWSQCNANQCTTNQCNAYSRPCSAYSTVCNSGNCNSYTCIGWTTPCSTYSTVCNANNCNTWTVNAVCWQWFSGNCTGWTPTCNTWFRPCSAWSFLTKQCTTWTSTGTCNGWTRPCSSWTWGCSAFTGSYSCTVWGCISWTRPCNAYSTVCNSGNCNSYTCIGWTTPCSAYTSVCNSTSCIGWSCTTWTSGTVSCNCTTDKKINIIKSIAGVITTVTGSIFSGTIASFRSILSGNNITIKAFSSGDYTSQIGSDFVIDATGSSKAKRHGIIKSPATNSQGSTIDEFRVG